MLIFSDHTFPHYTNRINFYILIHLDAWKICINVFIFGVKHFHSTAPPSGPSVRPVSQPLSDRTGKGIGRNPTIKISRATRVSEHWDASLDRVIANSNELRNLDEFLGNQVSEKQRSVDSLFDLFNQIYKTRRNLFLLLC